MAEDLAPVVRSRSLRIARLGHKGIPTVHDAIERHVDEIARALVSDIPDLEAIGDAGLRFRVRDPRALQAALAGMLRHPERVAEVGQRARDRIAAEYDGDQIARATEPVDERAVSGFGSNCLRVRAAS